VGFDAPQTIALSGAQAALPAWVAFMIDAVRQPELGFGEPPPGITMITVDPASGGIASGAPTTPPTPATNNALGAIGSFLGSLFGRH
jgi:membrane carboxypeptidase/penicillin-binding protein